MKVELRGKHAAANLFRGKESVGGKLYFEEEFMIFKSHRMNVQTGETRIPYSEMAEIRKRNTLGFVPNGISVIMKDKTEYKLVVNKRNQIIDFLSGLI